MLRMAAQTACEPLAHQLASGAATDEHLLDQLILPASLAHGTSHFLVAELSLHAQAAIHIAKLLVPEVQISEKRLWDLFLIEIKGIGHCVQADPAVREVAVLAEDAEERRRKRNLQRQFDKKVHELLCLKDTDEGAEGLREALATLAHELLTACTLPLSSAPPFSPLSEGRVYRRNRAGNGPRRAGLGAPPPPS